MGFRFHKSVKLFPGVRLNFSKSGLSTSVGVPGAMLNLGRRPRITLGVPGSGLSYTSFLDSGRRAQAATSAALGRPASSQEVGWVLTGAVLFSLSIIGIVWTARAPEPVFNSSSVGQPPAVSSPSAPPGMRRVLPPVANCRASPATDARVLTQITRGQQVAILAEHDGWSKVRHDAGTCWVAVRLLGKPISEAVQPSKLGSLKAAAPPRPKSRRRANAASVSDCACITGRICIGPRGGHYCLTAGGNKRYGR